MSDTASDRLEEIVSRRAKVQRLSLDLFKLLQNRKRPESDSKVAQLLVGASFSLWRAVFLLDADRGSDDIEKKSAEFLKTLIQDNAIAYPFERSMKSWSVGYYPNNAKYRIEKIGSKSGYEDTLTPLPVPRGNGQPLGLCKGCNGLPGARLFSFSHRPTRNAG